MRRPRPLSRRRARKLAWALCLEALSGALRSGLAGRLALNAADRGELGLALEELRARARRRAGREEIPWREAA